MIVKRLRGKHNWSQEQLAEFSGLSLRTIQRIEAGQQPSNESLMALAAVFEIEVDELKAEFLKIDKCSKEWLQKPLWLRILFYGSNTVWLRSKKEALFFEVFIIVCAFGFLFAAMIQPSTDTVFLLSLSLLCFISGYCWSILIRLSDSYNIWQTGN